MPAPCHDRKVDDDCVFRFCALEPVEQTRFHSGSDSCEALQRGKYVVLAAFSLISDTTLRVRIVPPALASDALFTEALRVGYRILQAVLRIRVFIHADSDNVGSAGPLQTVGPGYLHRVFVFYVVFAECRRSTGSLLQRH